MLAACRLHGIFLVLLYSALLLVSCNSGSNAEITLEETPVAVAPAMPDLPPPSELAAGLDLPRSTSYADEDLFHYGMQYNVTLPHNLVNASGVSANLAGFWAAGQGTDGLPYCTYSFSVPDYDRADEIHYEWETPPANIGNAYIGLSKWDGDHWAWFKCEADGSTSVGTIADYFDGTGLLLLVIAVAEQGHSYLRWVNLGMPNFTADLDATPERGLQPLEVTLDGSGSVCTLGAITKYEWDFEGDGTFDLTSPTQDTVDHTYPFAAEFNPVLRVTNSFGIERTATVPVTAVYPWSTSWGKTEGDEFYAVATDNDEFVYCAGRTQSYGAGHNDALLVKYDMNGQLIWAKCWGGPGSDVIFDIDVTEFGYICAVGSTFSFGEGFSDILVQYWDTDGNLVWCNSWGGSSTDQGSGIDAYLHGLDHQIYITASSVAAGLGADDGVLLRFDQGGSLDWAKYFGGTYNDSGAAVKVVKPLITPLEVHVGGTLSWSDSNHRLAHITFDEGGDVVRSYVFDGITQTAVCKDIYYTGGLTAGTLWLVGWAANGNGGQSALLLEDPPTGTPVAKLYSEDESKDAVIQSITGVGPNLVLAGFIEGLGTYQKALLLSVSGGGSLQNGKALGNNELDTRFAAICRFPESGVLAAGTAKAANAVTWQVYTPAEENVAGEWDLAPVSNGDANGTLHVLTGMGDLTDITTAVLDTGGGQADSLVTATNAP